MGTPGNTAPVVDEDEFTALAERHRHELRVHCYRMTGSLDEAEDLVQETFLRAWRGLDGFAGRSSLRTWLYRIATNACLDTLARRPRRVLPYDVTGPAAPGMAFPAPADRPWLEPYPDRLLGVDDPQTPEAAAVARETIELAFLAAIQHLPPRQRAVFVLRDVLGWPARDTADTLDMSVAAVKSGLQRARATLRDRLPRARADWGTPAGAGADERDLLHRYLDAHETGDHDALIALLREDLRVSFPPLPLWVDGRDAYLTGRREHADAGEYRMVAAGANRQPAVAVYLRPPGQERFRLRALEVLRVDAGRIAEIVTYSSPAVLASFGLPATI